MPFETQLKKVSTQGSHMEDGAMLKCNYHGSCSQKYNSCIHIAVMADTQVQLWETEESPNHSLQTCPNTHTGVENTSPNTLALLQ